MPAKQHMMILSKHIYSDGVFPSGSVIEIRYNPTCLSWPPQYGHNNEPFTLESLEKFLRDAITGEDTGHATYAEMYPEINKPNVFSISTLAFDNHEFPPLAKQIFWKTTGKQQEAPDSSVSMRMFRGKAIHEYFQERLVQRSKDWEREVEVRLCLPYNWMHLRTEGGNPCNEVILMGHADAVNFKTHEILEFKTSDYNGTITDYMSRQAGIYTGIMREFYETPFRMTVIKIVGNGGLKLVQPDETQVNRYVAEMIDRAYQCARILDEKYYRPAEAKMT